MSSLKFFKIIIYTKNLEDLNLNETTNRGPCQMTEMLELLNKDFKLTNNYKHTWKK